MSKSPSWKNGEWSPSPSWSQSLSASESEECSLSPAPPDDGVQDVKDSKISLLIGNRIGAISGVVKDSEEIRITTITGHIFRMIHHRDCCESVTLESFEPEDVSELAGALVVDAYEDRRKATDDEVSEYGTWTFYRIVTDKGTLVLRWLGKSNGCYSEDVDFEHIFSPSGVSLASKASPAPATSPAFIEMAQTAGVRKIVLG